MNSGGLIRLFVRHRNAANLLMLLIIAVGLVSMARLNTQFFPDFGIDVISISVEWRGASAEDVEANIVAAIEPEVRFLDGIDRVVASSHQGRAFFVLEFLRGADMQKASSDVESAVGRLTTLPTDAEKPVINRFIRHDTISRLVITGPFSESALKSFAKRIRDELLARGVDRVSLFGARDEEIHVGVEPRTLRRLDMTIDQIAGRIGASSLNLPAGTVESGVEKQIRSIGRRESAETLARLEVRALANGQKIHLGEIAEIEETFDENNPAADVNGQVAIELHVQRAANADALDQAKLVEQYLAERLGTLPKSLKVVHFDVQAGLIEQRINILLKAGGGGLVLVLAILFLFLNLRVAFWVAMGVPVALLATMFVMAITGQSINMISLFALIMTLGIIVDDAIVVGEHSATKRAQGLGPAEAAEAGAKRMLAPVVASSLTTIAAFLPLIVIGDIIGAVIRAIPMVAVSVLLASLVECFLILPGHLRGALKHGSEKDWRLRRWFNRGFDTFRDKIYRRFAAFCIRWRYLTLALALGWLVIVVSLIPGGRIGFQFFPTPESDVVIANVLMAPGTPRSRTGEAVRELQRAANEAATKLSGAAAGSLLVVAYGSVGRSQGEPYRRLSGDRYGGVHVELTPGDIRAVRTRDFIAAWRAAIRPMAGVELISLTERIGGPPGRELDIRLSGGSTEALKAASRETQALLARFAGASAIEDDLPIGKQEIILTLSARGRAMGFTTESLSRQVRHAFEGAIASRFSRGEEEVTIRVKHPDRFATSEAFYGLYVRGPEGAEVPLSQVVTLEERVGFDRIRRENGAREVRITGEIDESRTSAGLLIPAIIEQGLGALAERHGLTYRFAGKAEEEAHTLADMRYGAMIGLIAIYVILAWVFASYTRPIVVMIIIPFGAMGAIIGHLVMGFDLTILSMIALLGLSGILVNDSIILVSTIDERIAAGEEPYAAIVAGSCDRLRACF